MLLQWLSFRCKDFGIRDYSLSHVLVETRCPNRASNLHIESRRLLRIRIVISENLAYRWPEYLVFPLIKVIIHVPRGSISVTPFCHSLSSSSS